MLKQHTIPAGCQRLNLAEILMAIGNGLNCGLVGHSASYYRVIRFIKKLIDPVTNGDFLQALLAEDYYDKLEKYDFDTDNLISPLIVYDVVKRYTSTEYGVHTEYYLTSLGIEILRLMYEEEGIWEI